MNPTGKAFLREVLKATSCGLVDWRREDTGVWTAVCGKRRLTFRISHCSVTLTAFEGGAAVAAVAIAEPEGDLLFLLHTEILRHFHDAEEFGRCAAPLVKRGVLSPNDALDFIRERSERGKVRWKSSPNTLSASVQVGLRRLRAEIRYQGGGVHPEPESVRLSFGGADFEVGADLRESKAAMLAESAAKSAFGGLYVPPGEGGRP